ncbi:unnamed protein product, partial [Mesorhabditis belari]|uniref:Metalloendopeptidase n=1 Tax=Mesorhabditis belari TaxID=2138241 RepID=A0AAF3F4C0_9BILA
MQKLFFFWLLLGAFVEAKRGTRINIFSQKNGDGDITQLHAAAHEKNGNRVMMNALPRSSPDRWVYQKGNDGSFVIPYKITGQFDLEENSIIMDAMRRITANTCIRFQKWNGESDYVEVQNRQNEGCYTIVGRQPGRNVVMLEANDRATCVEPDIVIHELFHTIGLWHEHMRNDRDQYIRVNFDNIPSYYQSQFEKVTPDEATTYDIPYDYRSVMHYAEDAFAKPGRISMQTVNPSYQRIIGKAVDAAQSDYAKVCIMYGCNMCMGKTYDQQSLVNSLKQNPNNGVNPNEPINPPAPSLPPNIVPQILVAGNENETKNGNGSESSSCYDLFSPICGMISEGNFLFSCSSGFTARICCRTCQQQKEKENIQPSPTQSSGFFGLFGRK